mgnify:CR=1 FL=1
MQHIVRRHTRPLSRWSTGLALQGFSGIRVDIVEGDDRVAVSADLPGLNPEEIDVSITGDRLRLKGAYRTEEERERGNIHIKERRSGSFRRYIDLPASVDADEAEATFENGVLRIELPKAQSARRKHVEIRRPFEEVVAA